jgi:hypothetical protein
MSADGWRAQVATERRAPKRGTIYVRCSASPNPRSFAAFDLQPIVSAFACFRKQDGAGGWLMESLAEIDLAAFPLAAGTEMTQPLW